MLIKIFENTFSGVELRLQCLKYQNKNELLLQTNFLKERSTQQFKHFNNELISHYKTLLNTACMKRVFIGTKKILEDEGLLVLKRMADLLNDNLQKQSPYVFVKTNFLQISSKFTRRTPMRKCDFSKVGLQLYLTHTQGFFLYICCIFEEHIF